MSKAIQAIRGMNDLLPDAAALWRRAESAAHDALHAYGYREIRLPVVERTELFARSIGQHTDIVEKEMYTFEDRNGDMLTLRPEGTAGCVRAGVENGILYNQVQRLWYKGPMFRHERPQKGRYRQFHQIGAECFGIGSPDIDAELILVCARIWKVLGIEGLVLQINSLGTPESRVRYREELVRYLNKRRDELDEDSLRRLEKNPLRILDSKASMMQRLIAEAPSLFDYLDDSSRRHFDALRAYLDAAGIRCEVNPRLVRGLDYYTRTVFEWTTGGPGAQATVCAGGRYDTLVELLGGKPTPAVGFALGLERLVELMRAQGTRAVGDRPHVYIILLGDTAQQKGLLLAEQLRDRNLRVECNCGGGSMKSQMKRADRSGARHALILGPEEEKKGHIVVKDLRGEAGQLEVPQSEVGDYLEQRCCLR